MDVTSKAEYVRLARSVREHYLRMTYRGSSGHVGSVPSMAEQNMTGVAMEENPS